MPLPQTFQKAKLKLEPGEEITVLFNPREYSITKTNQWTSKAITGTTVPPAQFGGGQPRQMTLNGLLIDQSLMAPDTSVREMCDKLFKVMSLPDGSSGGGAGSVPPFVTFIWGANTSSSFKAVCDSLTVAYKLFAPNGEPIRAEVNMTLKEAQASEPAPQNPTTRAEAGLGVHTLKDGETLQAIAYRVYGDANRWRAIAEVNGIDNPLHIRRGTPLMLPLIDG
jgi:hypothetical protein